MAQFSQFGPVLLIIIIIIIIIIINGHGVGQANKLSNYAYVSAFRDGPLNK